MWHKLCCIKGFISLLLWIVSKQCLIACIWKKVCLRNRCAPNSGKNNTPQHQFLKSEKLRKERDEMLGYFCHLVIPRRYRPLGRPTLVVNTSSHPMRLFWHWMVVVSLSPVTRRYRPYLVSFMFFLLQGNVPLTLLYTSKPTQLKLTSKSIATTMLLANMF